MDTSYNTRDHPEHVYIIGAGFCILITAALYSVIWGPLAKLPGPWYTKWTSLVLTYKWLIGEKPFYVQSLHEKYGPVVRVSPYEADLCDSGAKQQIYNARETFHKSAWYERLVGSQNKSVFGTQDPDLHRRLRRLLSGPISETSLKSFEPIVRDRVDLAIERMGQEIATKGATNVLMWAMCMTTDVIGELSFGESFRTLEYGKKTQYIQDLENLAVAQSVRVAFPRMFMCCQKLRIPTPWKGVNQATTAVRNLTTYAIKSMDLYQSMVDADPDNVKPTLFTKMFNAKQDDALTLREVRDSAQSYIIAGSDTTAHTLTYLIWSVCKNPEVKERLIKEVQAVPAEYSDKDLMALPYLNQVIEETLRLWSAAPLGLPRTVPPAGATLAGYWFQGGVTVTAQAYSLHRNPDVFPRPEVFDPDRWAEPTKAMKDSFMPFGGGSRICLGLHLARMELRLASTSFFKTFPTAQISTSQGMSDTDMAPMIYLLLSPRGKRCLIEAPQN